MDKQLEVEEYVCCGICTECQRRCSEIASEGPTFSVRYTIEVKPSSSDEEAARAYTKDGLQCLSSRFQETKFGECIYHRCDCNVYDAFLAGIAHARAQIAERAEYISDARESGVMSASQEAAHYTWLDDQNELLKARIAELEAARAQDAELLEQAKGIMEERSEEWVSYAMDSWLADYSKRKGGANEG